MGDKDLIRSLIEEHKMEPHPEGGHYVEIFRNDDVTHIYFLLEEHENSHWHRITKTELLHFNTNFVCNIQLFIILFIILYFLPVITFFNNRIFCKFVVSKYLIFSVQCFHHENTFLPQTLRSKKNIRLKIYLVDFICIEYLRHS